MSNTDIYNGKALYDEILFLAHKMGMNGATAFKGVAGFGGSSVLHSLSYWEISDKMPVVVEIIDDADKIESFFEYLQPVFNSTYKGLLATIEKVNVVYYKIGLKRV
jgi:PII-like signaling protein